MNFRDVLYLAGVGSLTLSAFLVGVALGFAVLGVACFVMAWAIT
jgi:hypothetical protein